MSKYFSTLKSRLTSRGRSSTGSSSRNSHSEQDQDEDTSESDTEAGEATAGGGEKEEHIDLPVNLRIQLDSTGLLGATGWSSQISCVHYSTEHSLLFVGTEEGSLYVHGRDQQWMRPAPGEKPNRIVSISHVHPSVKPLYRLLLLLADGSVELVEFDQTTIILIDVKSPKAIGCRKDEKILTLYVDEAGMLPFAYLGSSRGGFHVIECLASSIRVCDYHLPRFPRTSSKMALVSIKICPKDERYIGLAYYDFEENAGLVVVYDMSKKKTSSQYHGLAVLTLEWEHTGNVLFAGTSTGELYALGIKQKEEEARQIWKYSGEDSDDIQIRKLIWLAPQESKNGDEGENSCLFALIASPDGKDRESITNPWSCAVTSIHFHMSTLTMSDCLMFPPPADENVTDFMVVPCTRSTVGLLMLSQRTNAAWSENSMALSRSEKYDRSLHLHPCPSSRVLDWELETGLIPDPIRVTIDAKIVANGVPPVPKVTCLAATTASPSGTSLGIALIQSAQQEKEIDSTNSILLSSVTDFKEAKISETRAYIRGDVVFLGDSHGGIKVFRVNPVKSSGHGCMCTYWSLLHQFSLGETSSPLRHFAVYEEEGIFIACNEAGEVGVWSVSETSTPRLLSIYKLENNEAITAISLACCSSGALKVFVGTDNGNLFFDSILDKKSEGGLKCVETMHKTVFSGRSKSICSLHPSLIGLSKHAIPVVYTVYTSGIVEAISIDEEISIAYGDIKQMAERNSHAEITALCVVDENMCVVSDGKRRIAEGVAHPTYLIASMSSALVYYHLDTFRLFDQSSLASTPMSATIKSISNCRVLNSEILQLGRHPYICLVDEIGVAALVTLDRRHPPVCYGALLDTIFKQQRPCVVRRASVCANGTSYLLVNDMIFVAKIGSSVATTQCPPPTTIDLVVPRLSGVKQSKGLRSGREDLVEKHRKELETRSVSMFMSMGVVTDLRKTFTATREESAHKSEDDDYNDDDDNGELGESRSLSSLAPVKAKSNDVKTSMLEARRNLELRGEKIEELQIKSEELAIATGQYKADAMNKRAYLEKKKNRWSLF